MSRWIEHINACVGTVSCRHVGISWGGLMLQLHSWLGLPGGRDDADMPIRLLVPCWLAQCYAEPLRCWGVVSPKIIISIAFVLASGQ